MYTVRTGTQAETQPETQSDSHVTMQAQQTMPMQGPQAAQQAQSTGPEAASAMTDSWAELQEGFHAQVTAYSKVWREGEAILAPEANFRIWTQANALQSAVCLLPASHFAT